MSKQGDYRLALDINTSAIGLVTYLLDEKKQPSDLTHVDVQVFGEPIADAKTGKLKKLQRREKRLMRRQVQRRAQRLKKIAHLFSLVGVTSEKVYEVQKQQTHGTVHKWRALAATEKIEISQLMAVLLVMAKNRGYEGRFTKEDGKVSGYIDEVKSCMEKHGCTTLGQLLYTLKNDASNHESMRAWKKISETGTYAHRDMLQEEFKTIWKKQKEYHDILNRSSKDDERINHVYTYYFKPDTVKSILPRNNEEPISLYDVYYMAMFDQRPIWWDTETIGYCELEPKYRRASRAHPVFQTYRIEQLLNDLKLKKRTLTKDEKEKIRPLFDTQKEVSANRLYTELGISNDRFTHDRGEEDEEKIEKEHKFMGNKTNCVLDNLEKDTDMSLNEKERALFIEVIADIDEPSVFGYGDWNTREDILGYFEGVDEKSKSNVITFINQLSKKEKIQTLKKMNLDTGRANYSVQALTKLLPHIQEGKRPDEARDIVYPEWNKTRHDNLSRVGDSVVQQALHETKKAIDYAIKKHGGQLPTQVVVEISREMKLSQDKRKFVEVVQVNQKKARDKAWEELKNKGKNPNETLCKKYIRWIEQGMECAYCGKCLGLDELCTNTETDHIVPKKYGGQSNHANLAEVCQKCNQQKSGKLPLEAFGGTENVNAIRAMSKKMKKPIYLKKQKPFDAYDKDVKRRAEILLIENKDDLEGDFKLRQNHETAWIGRELTAYLKQLCNISTTEKGTLEDKVYVTRGTLTAYVRRRLGLDTLIPDIRKQEGKPVFNRKGEVMEDGGKDACGSWHEVFADNDERCDKRSDHRHHAVDAAVIGLIDRSTFKKATNYYKSNHRVAKNGKTYPTLEGFEKDIPLQNTLRPMLKNRLHNYIVWHKPDKHPIDGFFDENIYRCESDTNKLIKRKNLSELVSDTFEVTKKNLELIVGENVRNHIIEQFEERYRESKETKAKEKCKQALCGVDIDDGIYYPVGTKNKIKRVRVYHKVTTGVGTYNKGYDKRIVVCDARGTEHTHVLNNDGYACFEIIKDTRGKPTYKPVPYHVYWTKEYQTRLKTDDGIVRIYKNDILYDRESEEYYAVKQLHASSGTLKCIKTTETMIYSDAEKKAKQLTKDFGKTTINNIQVIKSRRDMVDTMNTHESPSDCST